MPDAGTDLLIVTVAAPTNAVGTGHPSSWSTAGIERQVNILGGGQQAGECRAHLTKLAFTSRTQIAAWMAERTVERRAEHRHLRSLSGEG